MGKKYLAFDKLSPEDQRVIRDYWRAVKAEARESQRLKKCSRF